MLPRGMETVDQSCNFPLGPRPGRKAQRVISMALLDLGTVRLAERQACTRLGASLALTESPKAIEARTRNGATALEGLLARIPTRAMERNKTT